MLSNLNNWTKKDLKINSIGDFWENFNCTNVSIMRVIKGKEGGGKVNKNILAENCQIWWKTLI